jgi:predicted HTH transcriptional regulator
VPKTLGEFLHKRRLENDLFAKENVDPFDLVQFGAISERQKSIVDLITERGSITRRECQEVLGLRQQYAQNDLYFLYRLGVLRRTMDQRRKATYFLARDMEG